MGGGRVLKKMAYRKQEQPHGRTWVSISFVWKSVGMETVCHRAVFCFSRGKVDEAAPEGGARRGNTHHGSGKSSLLDDMSVSPFC